MPSNLERQLKDSTDPRIRAHVLLAHGVPFDHWTDEELIAFARDGLADWSVFTRAELNELETYSQKRRRALGVTSGSSIG